jgi:hypothetical protein
MQLFQTKRPVANKHGNFPLDCQGVGVDVCFPYFKDERTLIEQGGILLKDAYIVSGGIGYW